MADRTNIHGVILGGGAAVAEDLAGDHGGIHLPITIDEPIPSTSAGNWAGTGTMIDASAAAAINCGDV